MGSSSGGSSGGVCVPGASGQANSVRVEGSAQGTPTGRPPAAAAPLLDRGRQVRCGREGAGLHRSPGGRGCGGPGPWAQCGSVEASWSWGRGGWGGGLRPGPGHSAAAWGGSMGWQHGVGSGVGGLGGLGAGAGGGVGGVGALSLGTRQQHGGRWNAYVTVQRRRYSCGLN